MRGLDKLTSKEDTSGVSEQSAFQEIDPKLMALLADSPKHVLELLLHWIKRVLSAEERRSEDGPRVRETC